MNAFVSEQFEPYVALALNGSMIFDASFIEFETFPEKSLEQSIVCKFRQAITNNLVLTALLCALLTIPRLGRRCQRNYPHQSIESIDRFMNKMRQCNWIWWKPSIGTPKTPSALVYRRFLWVYVKKVNNLHIIIVLSPNQIHNRTHAAPIVSHVHCANYERGIWCKPNATKTQFHRTIELISYCSSFSME